MHEFAIFGDVHGEAVALSRALNDERLRSRRLIFVGDYINRGPGSRAVLDLLVEAKRKFGDQLTLLLGNHEVALLQLLGTGDARMFLRHSGATAIRSYISDPGDDVLDVFVANFPQAHRDLLATMTTHVETTDLLVSHVGYNPWHPMRRTLEDMTTGHWPSILSSASACGRPRSLVVCGHYVQRSAMPFAASGIICVDTGCGTVPRAPLTAFLLPEQEFLQYSTERDHDR